MHQEDLSGIDHGGQLLGGQLLPLLHGPTVMCGRRDLLPVVCVCCCSL